MDEVGIGVVGSSGVIGRRHTAEVSALAITRLVAVHDLNAEAAAEQAAEMGVRFHTDLDDLLGDPDVEAVTIATPHPTPPSSGAAGIRRRQARAHREADHRDALRSRPYGVRSRRGRSEAWRRLPEPLQARAHTHPGDDRRRRVRRVVPHGARRGQLPVAGVLRLGGLARNLAGRRAAAYC